MHDAKPKVSFVIPAKDEETLLPATLDKIHSIVCHHFSYEIIVIDNNSSDNTAELAKSKGALVITLGEGTIGSLRNFGVTKASGNFLVFIDADVSLTESWLEPFLTVIKNLKKDPDIITGSRCTAASSAGWIAKAWFQKDPAMCDTTHVGTGHMITSKSLFEKLGGFDEELQTGEDFEFCARAKKMGVSVFENRCLRVIHHGMPKTIAEFLYREIWHGAGDTSSFGVLVRSKVAVLSVIFFLAHIGFLVSVILSPKYSIFFLIIIILACVASSLKKYYFSSFKVIVQNAVLFYFYYWGRSISIIIRLLPAINFDAPRSGRTS